MRAVDTSAWIEWLLLSQTGAELATKMPDIDECVVPTMVQLELAKWLTREVSVEISDDVIAHTHKCVVVMLDSEIAASAAELSRAHRLATADAVIYATALASGADLLTCDAHFEGLPGVAYFAKARRN